MKRWLLLLPFILTGCLEDKESQLAECLLKYKYDQDDTMLCMDAKGHEFASRWKNSALTDINGRCWTIDKGSPAYPSFKDPACYHQRSLWEIWKYQYQI